MKRKSLPLIIMITCVIGANSLAQCPYKIESYTSGSASANSCPGVNGNPISSNFTGTSYATVPVGTKSGGFTARWGILPAATPAITAFYDDSVLVEATAGPASPMSTNGGNYRADYCFYGSVNLPTGTTYSVVFVNPQTNVILYTCSYTSSDNPLIQPTIATQPQSQNTCLGGSVTFTVAATPSTGSNTITYRWQKNGVNIPGVTGTTYTVNPVTTADTDSNIYRVLVVQNDGAIQMSNQVSLTTNNQAIWTGVTSSDWKTASNWSPAAVPDSTKHVYISNTTNKPNISASDTGRCKCLTLDAGWVDVAGNLEIAGPITLLAAGHMKATNGSVMMNGTSVAQTIPANSFENNTVKDLTYANSAGVSLAGTTNFTGVLTRLAGTLTTGGYLVLKSTSAGTAGTARIAEGVTGGISGDVTVERYVPAVPGNLRAWRLLAPITTGSQTIHAAWQEGATGINHNPNPGYGTIITCNANYSTTDGFDAVLPNSSILKWDVASQSLKSSPITNTNAKQLDSEPAYFLYIRGDRSVMPGASTSGATATTLRSKGTLKQGTQPVVTIAQDQFAVLANPYASAINFASIAASDRANLGNRFWLWDPRLAGSYGLGGYVLFDGEAAFTPSVTGGSYTGANSLIQMGMAFFVKATGGTGSFTARESQKSASNNNIGFKPSVNNERLHIQLSYMKDAATINPADGAFAIFHNNYANAVDADDASKPESMGENLAIVRDNEKLALEARQAVGENDTVALKMWKLRSSSMYRFTITPSFYNAGIKAMIIDRYLQTQQGLSMTNPTNVDFRINADSASFAPDRFYIALSAVPDPTTVRDAAANNITVYPNPTSAQNINVNMVNAAAGKYGFKIIDGMGRVVYNETYDHSGHSLTRTLGVQGTLVTGTYFIAISKDGIELATKKLTIN